jgi:hypothetical protein
MIKAYLELGNGITVSIENNNPVISTEQHGTYIELPDEHPIHKITDQHPRIIIPEDIKRSNDIHEFHNEGELYRFIDDRIVKVLKGSKKILYREIPSTSTEGVGVTNIHVCNVNNNERLCHTVYYNLKANKFVILITCYFAHNSGVKSHGKQSYKKNPSKAEFEQMKKYKELVIPTLLNIYNGGWQNA